jgi:hypothetical protein
LGRVTETLENVAPPKLADSTFKSFGETLSPDGDAIIGWNYFLDRACEYRAHNFLIGSLMGSKDAGPRSSRALPSATSGDVLSEAKQKWLHAVASKGSIEKPRFSIPPSMGRRLKNRC